MWFEEILQGKEKRGHLKISPKEGAKDQSLFTKRFLDCFPVWWILKQHSQLSTNKRYLLLSVYNTRHDLKDPLFQYTCISHLRLSSYEWNAQASRKSMSQYWQWKLIKGTYATNQHQNLSGHWENKGSGYFLPTVWAGNQVIKMPTILRTTECLFHITHHFLC